MIGPFFALVLSVYDGDTFNARIPIWANLEVVTAVRVRGIDTPEMRGKCQAEKDAALRARELLRQLLAAGRVELREVEPDKYGGRIDATVLVDGLPVAEALVNAGLARRYAGGTRQGWCP